MTLYMMRYVLGLFVLLFRLSDTPFYSAGPAAVASDGSFGAYFSLARLALLAFCFAILAAF